MLETCKGVMITELHLGRQEGAREKLPVGDIGVASRPLGK